MLSPNLTTSSQPVSVDLFPLETLQGLSLPDLARESIHFWAEAHELRESERAVVQLTPHTIHLSGTRAEVDDQSIFARVEHESAIALVAQLEIKPRLTLTAHCPAHTLGPSRALPPPPRTPPLLTAPPHTYPQRHTDHLQPGLPYSSHAWTASRSVHLFPHHLHRDATASWTSSRQPTLSTAHRCPPRAHQSWTTSGRLPPTWARPAKALATLPAMCRRTKALAIRASEGVLQRIILAEDMADRLSRQRASRACEVSWFHLI